VFSSQGNWYTHAHDVGAEGLRTFRIDRIESLTVIGQAENEAPDSMPEPGIWFADAEIERVTLRVAPRGRWIYERYPVDEVSSPDADGWVEVRLAVTSRQWLERLLLRLGDAVEVVDPSSMRVVRSEAATRVLVATRSKVDPAGGAAVFRRSQLRRGVRRGCGRCRCRISRKYR